MLKKLFYMPGWYKAWAFTVLLALLYSVYTYFSNGKALLNLIAMAYALGSIMLDNHLFPLKKMPDNTTVNHKTNTNQD